MQAKRAARWGLSALCLVLGALAVGCSSTREKASLESTNPVMRKMAVERLGEKRDMADYDEIVRVMRGDPDRIVRSKAAIALGQLGQRYYAIGFTPLCEALQNDQSVFVRAAAAKALSSTNDSRSVSVLVHALDDEARGEAVVLEDDHAVTVRACAADAARTSLEGLLGMRFAAEAVNAAPEKRAEMASQWQSWYTVKADKLPKSSSLASK